MTELPRELTGAGEPDRIEAMRLVISDCMSSLHTLSAQEASYVLGYLFGLGLRLCDNGEVRQAMVRQHATALEYARIVSGC